MFEHFAFGMSSCASRGGSGIEAIDDGHISPVDRVPGIVRRRSRTSPSPPPTLPGLQNSLEADTRPPVPVVDRLADDLSRQSLHLVEKTALPAPVQLGYQLRQPPIPEALPLVNDLPGLMDLEVDEEAPHQSPPSYLPPPSLMLLSRRNVAALPSAIPPKIPNASPEPHRSKQSPPVPMRDSLRLHRQRSSQFNNNPANARTIQSLMEVMIADGSQCIVKEAPPRTPTTPSKLPPIVEPSLQGDLELELPCVELEVDEAYCSLGDEGTWLDKDSILRVPDLSAAGLEPDEVSLPGLRYRLAAEAAFQCRKVVRSRPRMRKRSKRPGQSSRMTSRTMSLASVASVASVASTDTNQSYPSLPPRTMAP